jgi:hypothetical protein
MEGSNMRNSISGTVEGLRTRAEAAVPDMDDVRRKAFSAAGVVRENPLGLFFGAMAIGFLAGSLLPLTALEGERLGPVGDLLRERATERIQDTIGTVRETASDAVAQAIGAARHPS